jgi:hypothetical protein
MAKSQPLPTVLFYIISKNIYFTPEIGKSFPPRLQNEISMLFDGMYCKDVW